MIAEIINVGTELLLGQIINTNAAFLAKELSGLGINSYYQTVVGDNEAKLIAALAVAEARSDLLILTGGLGPTQDDITKTAVGSYLGEPLILHPAGLRHIEDWFSRQNRTMTANNEQQALYFKNGHAFANRVGHAVGTFLSKNGKEYLLLPGPPRELQTMFREEVQPFLLDRMEERQYIRSRILRFYGIGESELAARLAVLIDQQTNPTIAPYAGTYEVTLRVTASGKDEAQCLSLIESVKEQILAVVGEHYYGEGEKSLGETVGELLLSANLSISAAESLTGGLFQSELVKVPGISRIFPGGIVSYQKEAKQDVLHVAGKVVEEYGMVSRECAMAMARNCRDIFHTDIGISFTGAAGPDNLEGHVPGIVWIGISSRKNGDEAWKFHFPYDRQGVREKAVLQGFDLLRRNLLARS